MFKSLFLTIISLLTLVFQLQAQEIILPPTDTVKLIDLLQNFEKEKNIKCYYKNEWLKDLKGIEIKVKDTLIEEALKELLIPSKLKLIRYTINEYLILPEKEANYLISDTTELNSFRKLAFKKSIFFVFKGEVVDQSNKKPIPGVSIQEESKKIGTITDSLGRFELSMSKGKQRILFNMLGYKQQQITIILDKNLERQIMFEPDASQLAEVMIFGEAKDSQLKVSEIGMTKVNLQSLRKLPSFMGETDVVKSIIMLPGVSSVGEGATGFFVRGGTIDQNLILFDDVPIYNSSHLFGMFSIFHPDYAKDFVFYRGGIPVKYGGRISSVLDIKSKEGDFEKIRGRGGLSILTNRFSIEGPIVGKKLSFNFATRIVYTDWFLKLSGIKSLQNTKANFQDFNLRLDYKPSEKHKISFINYWGRDYLKLASDSLSLLGINGGSTIIKYSNLCSSLQWTYTPSKKVNLWNSINYSNYKSDIINPDFNPFEIRTGVSNLVQKTNFEYLLTNSNKFSLGLENNFFRINPGNLRGLSSSNITPIKVLPEQGLESAFYIAHDWQIIPLITINYGTRYSRFAFLGPSERYQYKDNLLANNFTILDTVSYSSNQVVYSYGGFEPRISLVLRLNEKNSLKFNYNRTRQYIHLMSNTTSSLPIDRWKLSDEFVKPQIADQYAIGFFRSSISNQWVFSWELYHRDIQNPIDFRGGAEVLLNKNIETSILQGQGKAQGSEWMIKKTNGKVNGWISYAYSQSLIKLDGVHPDDKINNGNWYPSIADRPHQLNLALSYQATRRWNIAINFVYNTGRPITYPNGRYTFNGLPVLNYEFRNLDRIPDYHRLDLSFTFEPNLTKNKKWESSWNFSIFNVYGRRNPFSVYFKGNESSMQAYQLSILGVAFPSITYNFKF
ncbi:MAG: TonB-dependent receptor [Cytophagales bacterium]|nr:MAG: TonB-dependent receptor [Cytophagales bacterium]